MYYRKSEIIRDMNVSSIFGDIVKRVSDRYSEEVDESKSVNFQFGDWQYISGILQEWSGSREMAKKKYPVICLFSPSDEYKSVVNGKTEIILDFLIATGTEASYSNDQRKEKSFKKVLLPIYHLFIEEIIKESRLDTGYRPDIPHTKTENYRYGRIGVNGPDGKPFSDKIDAIDIKNLKVTIKKR